MTSARESPSRVISPSEPEPRTLDPEPLRVFAGDCLDVLATLPAGFAQLAYLDPPFNTGRAREGAEGRYDDRWQNMDGYVEFMRPRLAATIRALDADGAVLVHCDWRTSHHFRLLLDELLGAASFINQLVWAYGLGGSSSRRFARKHDDILYYGRSDAYYFEPPLVAATSNRMKGQMKKATDVLAIPSINNMAAERTGYPTQKPLALLELLVGACCPPGGCVLDPFCGSGTTLEAASRRGRAAVGIDASPDAVALTRQRLGRA